MKHDLTRCQYYLKTADDPRADGDMAWTTVSIFDDPTMAARAFYCADRSRLPAVHAVAGDRDVVIAFTAPSSQWTHRSIVANVVAGVQGKEFERAYYDALESDAEARLTRVIETRSGSYDSRLHQDVEEFCKYSSEGGVIRRSQLIAKWIQAGQFGELSEDEKNDFAELWALHDVLDLEDEHRLPQRKETAQAMVENVRICASYGDAIKNNRPLCTSIKELTGFDVDEGTRTHVQSWSMYLPTVVRRIDEIGPLTEEDAAIFERHIKPMGEPHGDMSIMDSWQRARRNRDFITPPATSAVLDLEALEERHEVPARWEHTASVARPVHAAVMAHAKEEAIRRDPNASDEEIQAAKSHRKNAEFVAGVLNVGEDVAGKAARTVALLGPVQGACNTDRVSASSSSAPVPVRALDWWAMQREVLRVSGQNEAEYGESLRRLGPRPSISQTWWFQDGRLCAPPADNIVHPESTPDVTLQASDGTSKESEATVRDTYLEGQWVSEGGNDLHEPFLRRYVEGSSSVRGRSNGPEMGRKPGRTKP